MSKTMSVVADSDEDYGPEVETHLHPIRPDGFCDRHHRLLTYREFNDGRCCWCYPEDRPEWAGGSKRYAGWLEAVARINAPPATGD